jgi:hypothetical protein
LQDANWYEGGQWNQFKLGGGGDAGLTAVSRIPNSMDVFLMADCCSVIDYSWSDEPCPYCRASTTKTNTTRDVAVGTVKKSIEASLRRYLPAGMYEQGVRLTFSQDRTE